MRAAPLFLLIGAMVVLYAAQHPTHAFYILMAIIGLRALRWRRRRPTSIWPFVVALAGVSFLILLACHVLFTALNMQLSVLLGYDVYLLAIASFVVVGWQRLRSYRYRRAASSATPNSEG